MQTRIISAIIGLALLTAVILVGGVWIQAALLILSIMGVYELKKTAGYNFKLDFILSVVFLSLIFFAPNDLAMAAAFLYAFVCLVLAMFMPKIDFMRFVGNAFCFLYVSIPFFLLGRAISFGPKWGFILILTVAWGTDTFAYFAGSFFGSHKLAPKISPKKTWEGAIGGLVGALLLSVITGKILFGSGISLVALVVFTLVASVLSQLGDLSISHLKRKAGLKDSGVFLPGHGGVMDRFDALIVVTAVFYVFFKWLF